MEWYSEFCLRLLSSTRKSCLKCLTVLMKQPPSWHSTAETREEIVTLSENYNSHMALVEKSETENPQSAQSKHLLLGTVSFSTAPSRMGFRNLFECQEVASGPVSASPSPTTTVTMRSGFRMLLRSRARWSIQVRRLHGWNRPAQG